MKHEQEICRWAKSPKGTKIWAKPRIGGDEEWKWKLYRGDVDWSDEWDYVVDDDYSLIRKLAKDGAQIQVRYKNSDTGEFSRWFNKSTRKLEGNGWGLPLNQYRLKPTKDPKVCVWKATESALNSWIVGCNGFYFYLDNETEIVEGFHNCPYCGNLLDVEIKPEIVYEWQWIIFNKDTGKFWFTVDHYASSEELKKVVKNGTIVCKHEPSKRTRK